MPLQQRQYRSWIFKLAAYILTRQKKLFFIIERQNVQVTIKYGPEAVDDFIEIADAVEDEFPDLQVDGEEEDDLEEGIFKIVGDEGHIIFCAAMTEFNSETVIKVLRDSGIS